VRLIGMHLPGRRIRVAAPRNRLDVMQKKQFCTVTTP